MADVLDGSALARWRANPLSFIEQVLRDPETRQPFELFDAQREFLTGAFTLTDDRRLAYPEQVFGAIKKSGKSATAGMHLLTMTLVHGGRFAEGYAVANDFEQAQGRVFQAVQRIVECSPYLKREAQITQNRIIFPETGAVITAIASDYAGAAGANPVVSSFDELWAFTSERSRRLWDEMVPPPTRKVACRLTTTYAGFSGESQLLEELYRRGMAQPQVGAACWRRFADGVAPRTGRALADRGVAGADAPVAASQSIPAHDRKPLCHHRKLIHRLGDMGSLRPSRAWRGAKQSVAAGVGWR